MPRNFLLVNRRVLCDCAFVALTRPLIGDDMGTNFFWRVESVAACAHCGRDADVDKHHIGKSSMGWTFTFAACADLGVASFADWQRVFAAGDGMIVDEYGETWTTDDFIQKVHGKATAAHNHAREYPQGSYLDADGHSFTTGEFR